MAEEPKDKIEITKEQWDKVQETMGAVAGITSDLKTEREKRQLAEAALEEAKKAPVEPQPTDVEKTAQAAAQRIFDEQKKQDTAKNFTTAETQFKNAHKEFHPDNDAGGIKFAAVKAKLGRINLSGLTSVEDFTNAFNEALTLMTRPVNTPNDFKPDASMPNGSGSGPASIVSTNLSAKEMLLLKQTGWTEERYLSVKKKQPDYVQSILSKMV